MAELPQIKNKIKDFLDSDSGPAAATKIILSVLAVAGVLVIAMMAPNIFQIFKTFKKSRNFSDKQIQNGLYALKRRGFVKIIQEKDEKIKIELTNKGKVRVREFSLDSLKISKPKKWDGKWRVVIFDIPNKFNQAREALRKKLKDLEFYQLQKSVWVNPYPCEDEILFIANLFEIERFLEILVVEKLLHENKLKNIFKIS